MCVCVCVFFGGAGEIETERKTENVYMRRRESLHTSEMMHEYMNE